MPIHYKKTDGLFGCMANYFGNRGLLYKTSQELVSFLFHHFRMGKEEEKTKRLVVLYN